MTTIVNLFQNNILICILIVCFISCIISDIVLMHKYHFLKKRRILLIEMILIICLIFVGFMLFMLTRDKIESNIEDKLSIKQSSMRTPSEAGLTDSYSDENVLSLESEFIYNILGSDMTAYDRSQVGFTLHMYNRKGELIDESEGKTLLIFYHPEYYDTTVILDLEQDFSTKELNQLMKYATDGSSSDNALSRGLNVNRICGYKKDGVFHATQVEFEDWSDDSTYVLGKKDSQSTITYDSSENSMDLELYDTTESNIQDMKELNVTFLNEEYSIKNILNDLGPGTSFASTKTIKGYYLYGYMGIENQDESEVTHYFTYSIYLNTLNMALHSYLFYFSLVCVLAFVHGWETLCLSLYVIKRKKEIELEEGRNTFINAMAHEMKTPAAVILNSTELLQEEIKPEKREHYIDMIQDETIHLNDLLQKMLTYTRTGDGYLIEKKEINLLMLTKDVIKHYEGVDDKIQIEIPEDAVMECDPQLLSVVIDNYISNAVRYTTGVIRIRYFHDRYSVYNNGSRITEKDIKHIWEPLYQADSSRNDANTSGMGLAICANILKLHNFQYGVLNEEDGVTFYFEQKRK